MANGRKNQKGNPVGLLMALLILLLLIIAVIVVLRSCSQGPAVSTPTPPAATQTPTPAGTPEPTPTPEPTETPEPTVSPTPEDTQTPVPTAIPPATATGSIRSDTGTDLNLVADWEAYSAGDNSMTLAVTLYAESYSLTCRAIFDGAVVTIDGSDIVFDTAAVEYSGDELHKSELGSVSVTMPLGEDGTLTVPISAVWNFGGSYSGTDFATLSAEGVAQIG